MQQKCLHTERNNAGETSAPLRSGSGCGPTPRMPPLCQKKNAAGMAAAFSHIGHDAAACY
ncbi:hypothetical protein BTO02_02395 [Paraburkholderia sp. SOS3]|nr:hypothetical protein BTO02_02395 [Paraburkholderia sp. SOS3]